MMQCCGIRDREQVKKKNKLKNKLNSGKRCIWNGRKTKIKITKGRDEEILW